MLGSHHALLLHLKRDSSFVRDHSIGISPKMCQVSSADTDWSWV